MFRGDKKLKLDLHTHCSEATNLLHPNRKVVRKIIDKVKERGMDGIAITEHTDKGYAYEVKEIIKRSFNDEIVVIPGQEIKRWVFHIVELYLEENYSFSLRCPSQQLL